MLLLLEWTNGLWTLRWQGRNGQLYASWVREMEDWTGDFFSMFEMLGCIKYKFLVPLLKAYLSNFLCNKGFRSSVWSWFLLNAITDRVTYESPDIHAFLVCDTAFIIAWGNILKLPSRSSIRRGRILNVITL